MSSDTDSKTLKGIAAALETLTDATRPLLNPREAAKLDAIALSLENIGKAAELGNFDADSARSTLKSILTIGLNELGGVGIGVVMASLTAYASSVVPMSPAVKGTFIVGAGITGFIIDSVIGDSGAYDRFSDVLVDAIFDGAAGVANFLTNLQTALSNNTSFFTGIENNAAFIQEEDFTTSDGSFFAVDPGWIDADIFSSITPVEVSISNFNIFDDPSNPNPTLYPL